MVAPAARAASPPRPIADVLTRRWPIAAWLPMGLAAIAFVLLLRADPVRSLLHDWRTRMPATGIAPCSRRPLARVARRPRPATRARARPGAAALLTGAILLRALGALAAEFYTQRISIAIACVGLVVFFLGWKQVREWWLPITLLVLAIPLPALVINKLAIPLQFRASALGTALIQWRHIPVRHLGNVIEIPGQRLFVAEACSGLRSISALLALGFMLGGMYLATVPARLFLVLLAIPVAVLVNGVRIFMTAFLVYFVDPALGAGVQAHESTGWLLFMLSFAILAGLSTLIRMAERRVSSAEVTGA